MEPASTVLSVKVQRLFLLACSVLLAAFLFAMKIGFAAENSLDKLARSSLQPEVALQNNLPTIIEFYADWCEACKEMAPSMSYLKEAYAGKIDIVLLNVDNQKWLDLINKYEVNGIPHLDLFDKNGVNKGHLVGIKNREEINYIAEQLLNNNRNNFIHDFEELSENQKLGYKLIKDNNIRNVSPRSHG